MSLIESVDDLTSWDVYKQFVKTTLKLLGEDEPAFISKDKLDFDINDTPWSGHAFLAGKKAVASVQRFKKEGVLFREGLCTLSGKELRLTGFPSPKLVKEARKTLLKLKLGFEIQGGEDGPVSAAEGDAPAGTPTGTPGGGDLAPERRKEILGHLSRMESEIDRLMAALGR